MQATRANSPTSYTSTIVPAVERTYRVTLLSRDELGLTAHFYHPRALNAEVARLDALADHYAAGGSYTLKSKVERVER